MSYFEVSLLGGLALGGVLGGQLWRLLGTRAFAATALVYVISAGFLYAGAGGSRCRRCRRGRAGVFPALRAPPGQRLGTFSLFVRTRVRRVWRCLREQLEQRRGVALRWASIRSSRVSAQLWAL